MFICLVAVAKFSGQVNYSWVKTIKASAQCWATSVKTATSGNVYLMGNFTGTTDFDPGPSNAFLTPNGGGQAMYFCKFDASGNFIWAKQISNSSVLDVVGSEIEIDASENLFITGHYTGNPDFDPNVGTFTLTPCVPSSDGMFLAKYDLNGNFVWVRNWCKNSYGRNMAIDANQNIYVCGEYNSGTPYFLKYNNSGVLQWIDTLACYKTSYTYNFCNDIITDANNDIYVTGCFVSDSIDMNSGSGASMLKGGDMFLGKYTSIGNLIWAQKTTGLFHTTGGYQENRNCIVDNSGNVFVTGFSINQSKLVKWDTSGNLQWINSFGNMGTQAKRISFNCANNIILCGNTGPFPQSNVNFDPLGGTYTLSPQYIKPDLFIGSYAPTNGAVNWVIGVGGQTNGTNQSPSMYINNTGDIYISGEVIDTCDFNPTPTNVLAYPLSLGVGASYFAKYTGCNAVGIHEYQNSKNLRLHPNPSSGVFSISGDKNPKLVVAYDLNGREVYSETLTGETTSIDLSSKPSGLYLIKIINSTGEIQTGKLLLEN